MTTTAHPAPAATGSIATLIVDDHSMVRAGLTALLGDAADIDVVGEAADGHEAIRKVAELNPSVAVVDLMMPGLGGIETIARLTADHPSCRTLALSMHNHWVYACRAIAAGARGYVVKAAQSGELENAIRAVAAGDQYLPEEISERLQGHACLDPDACCGCLEKTRLTRRQREVLQLIAEGLSTKQIARKLFISAKTVEKHRGQLMQTLEMHDVASLVRYAIRTGIASAED